MALAIQAEGLSKSYRLGKVKSVYGMAKSALGSAEAKAQAERARADFWALQDVSFQVDLGESVAIIGANGSGKSTLLKTLSRIVVPTSGRAMIYGRIGSLLEVGTGMHPELTGLENVMLNGSILGMRRREILRELDSIVEFAGVGAFMETPLKRYSTGMQVRLAFAVAAHLKTEMLIVDEVLSVGDAAFQRKCLARLDDAVTQEGRSVLLVTHNLAQARQLCPRALVLESGRLTFDGETEAAIGQYMSAATSAVNEMEFSPPVHLAAGVTRLASGRVDGLPSGGFSHSDEIELQVDWVNRFPGADMHVVISLVDIDGLEILQAADDDLEPDRAVLESGLYRTAFTVPGNILNEGSYQARVTIVERNGVVIDHQSSGVFEVHDVHDYTGRTLGKRGGAVLVPVAATQERIGPADTAVSG